MTIDDSHKQQWAFAAAHMARAEGGWSKPRKVSVKTVRFDGKGGTETHEISGHCTAEMRQAGQENGKPFIDYRIRGQVEEVRVTPDKGRQE